ncbi:MAG: cytochrome c biogenesis protein CcsA [Desulfuromonadia bacterium]
MKELLLAASALHLFGGWKIPFFVAALLCQVIYLCQRGVSLGRLPIVGPHDTIAFFGTSIALMGLPFILSPRLRHTPSRIWSIGGASALFTLFSLLFPPPFFPLPPVLKTLWFEFHVALAFFAYGLFMVAAILAAFDLSSKGVDLAPLQYRAVLVGFTFFSLSMVTGGIWGYYAWGTYWLWTPKELWTSILWLFYALWLHLRLKGGTDTLCSWGALLGAAVTLFTYLGVSMLMKSSHSF